MLRNVSFIVGIVIVCLSYPFIKFWGGYGASYIKVIAGIVYMMAIVYMYRLTVKKENGNWYIHYYFIVRVYLSLSKVKKISCCFFIFMWLLWGFNTFNGDYIAYEDTFLSPDFSSSPEFGYLLLNSIVGCFTSSYQVFLALMSLGILFVMYRISSKYSPYPALFALIYFLIFLMEFVFNRNYIVTTIFLCALLTFSQTENNKYFIVLVLLGCTVHSFCFYIYSFYLVLVVNWSH